jgi:hypothetical protein
LGDDIDDAGLGILAQLDEGIIALVFHFQGQR